MLSGDEYAHQAVKAGASGYLTKGEASGLIVSAIKSVYKGESYISPIISTELTKRIEAGSDSKTDVLALLTPREFEIFIFLGEGKTIKEIASTLTISTSTVGTHTETIKKKFNISNLSALIRYAMEWSLLCDSRNKNI